MIGVRVTIPGSVRVQNRLRRLASKNKEFVQRLIVEHYGFLRRVAKAMGYPAAPPKSNYRRTGRIANSYYGNQNGFGNSAPYAAYVVDERSMAWMHRGRWDENTIQAVERKHRPRLTKNISKGLVQLYVAS